jgi:uncharacterized protein (TIGR03437 family)
MISKIKTRFAIGFVAVLFPAAAWADLTGTLTVAANTSVSMDTGAVVSSGGDFSWNGTTLTPLGSVKALNGATLGFSGASEYALLTQALIMQFQSLGSASPIAGLAANSIVAYETNGGNYGKLLVTSVSGGTLVFQYTTYGVSSSGSGGGTPTVTQIQNNYGLIVPGLPNYGIAPGSLFIIRGTNLASIPTSSVTLQSSAGAGIPLTLNGASISVTVNGTTVRPGIYYAGATQIAAVLPSSTPIGTGTLTVTYAGTPSAAASIVVVSSALGLDTYYGSGTGLGVATSPTTGALYNYTNSISPGSTIVLWGSGLGADTADSDTVFTSTPHPVSSPLTIYIGGVQANVLYAGSAGYPGVNQINVTVPSSVPTGCGVSVVAVSGSIVSNTVTLPFGSGVCSDPVLGYNGTQLTNSGSQSGTYTVGEVTLDQSTTPAVGSTGGQTTGASAIFEKITYNAATTSSGITSLGSCAVSTSSTTISIGTIPTIVGLDAGNITVTGPTGTQPLATEAIPTQTGPSGLYFSQLANSFLPATGGSFTFTGSGGKDVGAFTATISIGNVLNWTNQSSLSSVTRTNGVTLNWTGGSSNSYVYIQGTSSSNSASASFLCYAPASAGQFTVPSYVLLALPPSTNGTLGIANGATPTSFTASGLTNPGIGIIAVSYGITASYN